MSHAIALLAAALLALGCSDHDHAEHAAGATAHVEHDDHEGAHDERGEGDAHAEGTVTLTPAALARSGIRVAQVARGSLGAQVSVAAEVQLNPNRVAHISPLVDGKLLDVRAAVGDRVEREQPLVTLRSIALGQARAELERSDAMLAVARKTLRRQRKLRSAGINSERALIEARLAFDQANAEREAARSRLKVFGIRGGNGPDMELISPIAGRVVERHATRGESVSPDDTLFIVADLSSVWIIGRVYEQQVAQVQAGMPATLTLNAWPGQIWQGTVDYVGAMVDETTRTLPIRVELANPDGRLRPGLFGTLQLAVTAGEGAGVIAPADAVQTIDGRTVVFVPGEAPGAFERRVVTLGRRRGAQVEIVAGIEPGQAVVVAGGFILKSELMRSELGHGHAH